MFEWNVTVAAANPPASGDEIDQKFLDLRKAVNPAGSRERTRELLGEALSLVDQALVADQFTAAIRIATFAAEMATILENENISVVTARRKDEILNIAREAKKLAKAMEKLEKSPTDPVANFAIGRFRCAVCGDWERGLPLLARGNNVVWGAAARRDVANPKDADGQIALGNEWARLASGEKGQRKLAIAKRAAHWYRQALKQGGASRKNAADAMGRLPICYLTDLDESEVKGAFAPLGRYGDFAGGTPIAVNGFKYPMSLGLHPPAGDEATVKYKLDNPYKTLVSGVAINDLQLEFKDTVIFLVVGDGEVLWKSSPVTSRNTVIFCEVNVKGVKTLELKTRCPGGNYSAHAVWLDPYLLK